MSRAAIHVDGDACSVREEVYRVAERLNLDVHVVSNGARGVRLPDAPNIHRVIVAEGPDAADDWIVEHIRPGDVCVTADIPLAARCLAAGAGAIAPSGKVWDTSNIGGALAGREVSRHLREVGAITRGPPSFGAAQRARFLQALDAMLREGARDLGASAKPMPNFFE